MCDHRKSINYYQVVCVWGGNTCDSKQWGCRCSPASPLCSPARLWVQRCRRGVATCWSPRGNQCPTLHSNGTANSLVGEHRCLLFQRDEHSPLPQTRRHREGVLGTGWRPAGFSKETCETRRNFRLSKGQLLDPTEQQVTSNPSKSSGGLLNCLSSCIQS